MARGAATEGRSQSGRCVEGFANMKLGAIRAPKGGVKARKRLGCGRGAGQGKTCGRGHKGQKSRSGGKIPPWFEGGQMPLQRRLPKVGFVRPSKVVYQVVNLDDMARRGLTGEVTPETLEGARLIRSAKHLVKVLGRGEVQQALKVRVHAVSSSASEKIAQAGGSVELLSRIAPKAE